jgi:alcohol dehydrogenase
VLALWLERDVLETREVNPPQVGPDEALVAVTRAGICGTDLELRRGYAGFSGIPGHEFVGVVEQCASDPRWEGRRIVAEINVGCGSCQWCEAGAREHCERRTVMGIRDRPGAFATHIAVPVPNLHAVPEGVDDDNAVFAEPIAAAFEILEQVEIQESTRVAIVGDGKLGLVIAMVLGQAGVRPTVFGRYTGKRELAESFGAIARQADDPTGGFDVVIEATGRPEGLAASLDRVRPRGTVVIKTTHPRPTEVDLGRLVVDEIRLVGSRCGPFERALSLLGSGRIDPKVLVEAVYPLSRAPEAFEHAGSPGALKVLLKSR